MSAFRGFLALDGIEIANSSRVVAHIGRSVPTKDIDVFAIAPPVGPDWVENPAGSGLWEPPDEASHTGGLYTTEGLDDSNGDGLWAEEADGCAPQVYSRWLYNIPDSSTNVSEGLWTIPNGARRFGPGLMQVTEDCWGLPQTCTDECRDLLGYDDSWPGLSAFLGDNSYRPEIAPWYTVEEPQSAEFAGVWIMSIDGLGPTPVERQITPAVGAGGVAGPSRDAHRTLRFEAILIGCTHAGVQYGLHWLACLLRDATYDTTSSLRYLIAHPSHTAADPDTLVREAAGVVLTQQVNVKEEFAGGGKLHQQATVYRVGWEMAVLSPYAYLPAVDLTVDWDEITRQPINWIHQPDCALPETCVDMPVLFSTDCVPEQIEVVNTPPPVCGGCLPVGEILKYSYRVPTMEYAFHCRETAVSMTIRNTGETSLTLQAFWRVCGTDVRCEDNRFPLQVSGLPAGAELVLDGVTGRFKAWHDERWRRPVGVVGTPSGAPWMPPVIDRQTCWDFIVQASNSAEFEVTMSLRDRES